jgi:hypothetical protein
MMLVWDLNLVYMIVRWKMRIGCGCSGWVWCLIGVLVERDSLVVVVVVVVEVWRGKRMGIEALDE